MTTREQRLRELVSQWKRECMVFADMPNSVPVPKRLYLWNRIDELAAILAEPVEVSDASDDEVRQWVGRHDLQLSITSAREAFEDAQTFHMLKARKEPGQ